MNSIVYVGMDVHKESYTLCCFTVSDDQLKFKQKIKSDYKLILAYLDSARLHYGENVEFICGYEAGSLGYSLYHELTNCNVNCVIMAPTTLGVTTTNRVKTDKHDAGNLARCLAFRTYKKVYIPTADDNSVKEFIRMRDDHKKAIKSIKQQISAFALRHGHKYSDGNKWTSKHITWLKSLKFSPLLQEVFDEYLLTHSQLTDKIERLDERIEELASHDQYREKVQQLSCFLGVKTYTALSVIVEVGDFNRFESPENFASFLGLVPSEGSSGDRIVRGSITKAGNGHVRKQLIEASQSFAKGQVGYKSKALKARQKGNLPEVISYADKANERLRRKFYRLTLKNGRPRNVAVTAVARELACFMWGMMTGNVA